MAVPSPISTSSRYPNVDGTLFRLPDTGPPAAAEPAEAAEQSAETQSADDPSFETPSFDAASFDTGDEPADEPSFEVGGFDGGSFDDGAFGAAEIDASDFAAEFDAGGLEDDETSSQVAPPPDIGDEAGKAWDADFDATGASSQEAVAESTAASAQPAAETPADEAPAVGESTPPQPSREESDAMDIEADDFAFEPPAAGLLDGAEAEPAPDDRSDVATPESVAAAALAGQMAEPEPTSQFETQPTPPASHGTSTDTADDLFAFRGPPDAQPALDPEETASLRKGALPDLSETMMGTKAPEPPGAADSDDELQDSYDDWEEWAPHPTKSSGRTKTLIGVALLIALVGGASYFFRSTLLPMIGFGGGSSDSALLEPPPAAADDGTDDGVVEYETPDDPLAEPVEVAEPDPDGADQNPGGNADDAAAQTGAATQATADSLRPPSTRTDPPPQQSTPPPPARPPPTRPAASSTGSSGASSGTASRIQSIEVRPGASATEVVIQLDGSVGASRFTHDPLAWAPDRERVKLHGFENFKQTQIAGRGSHVKQIRVGFHPGKELHLVFDLVAPSVSIQNVQARGNRIVVRLGG